MPDTEVDTKRQGHVGVITLTGPDRHNALSSSTSSALWEAMEELDADAEIRAIVIASTGSSFCAGADLRQVSGAPSAQGSPSSRRGLVPYPGWTYDGDTPLIAAVQGPALGAGFLLAQICDLVVAAPRAVFGIPEIRHGLSGAWAAAMPHWVPARVVMEMLLTGETITADRAHQIGLVNRVVESEFLLDETLGLAHRIAEFEPLNVRASRAVVRDSVTDDLDATLRAGYDAFRPVREARLFHPSAPSTSPPDRTGWRGAGSGPLP